MPIGKSRFAFSLFPRPFYLRVARAPGTEMVFTERIFTETLPYVVSVDYPTMSMPMRFCRYIFYPKWERRIIMKIQFNPKEFLRLFKLAASVASATFAIVNS